MVTPWLVPITFLPSPLFFLPSSQLWIRHQVRKGDTVDHWATSQLEIWTLFQFLSFIYCVTIYMIEMQMQLCYKWSTVQKDFHLRLVSIISSIHNLWWPEFYIANSSQCTMRKHLLWSYKGRHKNDIKTTEWKH